MAKLGTSQNQRAQQAGNSVLEDQHEIEKGDNLFRFIQGPQMIKTIFYPSISEEESNGKTILKPAYKALNFIDKTGLIEAIQGGEMDIRTRLADEEEMGFKDKPTWFYLAINLQQSIPTVKPIKVPKTIKDKINGLETKLDIKDPSYLMNGLFWMYDILVSKTIEPGKSARYGTKYDASVYGENPWMSKIPADYLKGDAGSLIAEAGGMGEFFPAELIPLVEDCEIDLEKALAPMSELQIRERLQKYPINILGRRSNDHTLFYPQTPAFGELLKSLGLPYVEIDVLDGGQGGVIKQSGSADAGSGGIKSLRKSVEAPAPAPIINEPPVETAKAAIPAPIQEPVVTETQTPPVESAARVKKLKPKLKDLKAPAEKGKW